MNLNDSDLRNLYASRGAAPASSARVGCPTRETLLRTIDAPRRSRAKRAVIDHAADCPACARELKWMLELRRETASFSRKTGAVRKAARTKMFGFNLPLGQAAAMLLGTAALSVSLWTLMGGDNPFGRFPEQPRTEASFLWKLLEPSGKIPWTGALAFRWTFAGRGEEYVVDLFDEALAPVWESARLAGKTAVLPADQAVRLIPQKRYFWMVTAYDQDGYLSESDLASFELRLRFPASPKR